MIVNGILLALGGIVILVTGAILLDIRLIIFGLVFLVGGLFGIWWFVKWPRGQSSWWKR